jgi:hypothetical protein
LYISLVVVQRLSILLACERLEGDAVPGFVGLARPQESVDAAVGKTLVHGSADRSVELEE